MGKLKKPCKNAYFFFVMQEKEKHEAMGYRIQGGFNSFSQTFGFKWSTLTKEERAPYEKMAKEAKEQEKYNITNKFTVTGESYAQVHQKQLEQRTAYDQMSDFISRLVSGPEAGDRMFIFMKAVHCVEEIIDRKTKLYWPSELALAAFSLKGGIKSIYTQLVDTEETPTGYASQAKENCEETLLPMPGNRTLFSDECRDYIRILKNINGFANHWLKDGYDLRGHTKVFFALDEEAEPIVSCLQWMVNKLKGKDREKYQRIVDNLKVYRISKLILTMAEEANRVNPAYDNYLVQFKLDKGADAVVMKGNFDYREEIACGYHRSDCASLKLHNCAQSIVMRRIFMLFEEFVPAFKFDWCDRHRIDKLGKGVRGPVIKKKREKSPTREEMKVEEPCWLKSEDNDEVDTWDYSKEAPPNTIPSSWGSRPAAAASFENDDFPSLGASGGGSSSNRAWERRPSPHSTSRSPPESSYGHGGTGGGRSGTSSSTRRSSSFMDDESVSSSGTVRSGGVSSSRRGNFMDDDYPPPSRSTGSERSGGVSSTRRSGSFMDDDYPPPARSTGAERSGGASFSRRGDSFMDDDDFPPRSSNGTERSGGVSSTRRSSSFMDDDYPPPSRSTGTERSGGVSSSRRGGSFMDDDDFSSRSSNGAGRGGGASSSRRGNSFMDDDDLPPVRSAGTGRGGGGTSSSRNNDFMDDDEDFPPLGSVSRGRGHRY